MSLQFSVNVGDFPENDGGQNVFLSCGPSNITSLEDILTVMPAPTFETTTFESTATTTIFEVVTSSSGEGTSAGVEASNEDNNTSSRLGYVIIGTVCAIVIVCLVVVIVAVVIWARNRRTEKENDKVGTIRQLMKDRSLSSSHMTYERNSYVPEDNSNGVAFVTYDYDGIMVDTGKKSETGRDTDSKQHGSQQSVRFSSAVDEISDKPPTSDEAAFIDEQVTVDPKSEDFMFWKFEFF